MAELLAHGRGDGACYFRFSTAGAAGFGLSNTLDIVLRGGAGFFLSAFGFLASRLVLFWPFAINVLLSGS
jgi:hypothetical protein